MYGALGKNGSPRQDPPKALFRFAPLGAMGAVQGKIKGWLHIVVSSSMCEGIRSCNATQ